MRAHKVKQGEDLTTVAAKYGISDWEAVYNHAANERLRKYRPNPFQLVPGDIVIIPDTQPISYNLATNQKHTIKISVPTAHFSVKLVDNKGKPLSNVKYKLAIGDSDKDPDLKMVEGSSSDGVVTEKIPVNKKTAILQYWPDPDDAEYSIYRVFNLGNLNADSDIEGLSQRLNNLGYENDPNEARVYADDRIDALKAARADQDKADDSEGDVANHIDSL